MEKIVWNDESSQQCTILQKQIYNFDVVEPKDNEPISYISNITEII